MQNTIYFEMSNKVVLIAEHGRLCSLGIILFSVLCEYRQYSPQNLHRIKNIWNMFFTTSIYVSYLLTHSMVQSPLESNWFAASPEIPRI